VTRPARPPLALTYHGIADVPLRQDPHHLFVRPADFVRQIERLRSWGYELVTFGELADRVAAGAAAGAAALTFDDGLADNFETLAPLLDRESAPATVFVVSGWLGRQHPTASWARMLTPDEVRSLRGEGVEIGAHTVSHPDLAEVPYATALEELCGSKRALEELLAEPVEVAAYPYGSANAETRAAAREAGFKAACRTIGEGSWADPYDLPRQAMENRGSLLGLRLKRDGRYEPLMRFRAARGVRRLSRRAREAMGA
jgi:peptidoglycan/xylan/chitin deacetylase (PgdA/CDA1 family)